MLQKIISIFHMDKNEAELKIDPPANSLSTYNKRQN